VRLVGYLKRYTVRGSVGPAASLTALFPTFVPSSSQHVTPKQRYAPTNSQVVVTPTWLLPSSSRSEAWRRWLVQRCRTSLNTHIQDSIQVWRQTVISRATSHVRTLYKYISTYVNTYIHTIQRDPKAWRNPNCAKGKGLLQQAEVAQGVPDRLKHRIFLTFGTTRVVGRQPYAPAAFTPGDIPGTHF